MRNHFWWTGPFGGACYWVHRRYAGRMRFKRPGQARVVRRRSEPKERIITMMSR